MKKVKFNHILLFSFLLFLLYNQLSAQTMIPNYLAEELNYSMEYFAFSTGTLQFKITAIEKIDSTSVYHLIVTAKTNALFSHLFKVRNIYESFFNMSTYLPILLKKNINQKNIQHQLTIHFNQEQHIASISDSVSWHIPFPCYDFFSMIYFLRNQNFMQGDAIQFYLDAEYRPSKVRATFTGNEIISIYQKRHNAQKVNLQFTSLASDSRPWRTDLLTNRFTNPNSKVTIWFSDDANHLPLVIQFNQKPFDVKLVLTKYKIGRNE